LLPPPPPPINTNQGYVRVITVQLNHLIFINLYRLRLRSIVWLHAATAPILAGKMLSTALSAKFPKASQA